VTPQEWIDQEIAKSEYEGQPPERIAAYLNARPRVETPGEGTVTESLTTDEVTAIIKDENPGEWVAITSPSARWADAKAEAVTAGYADAIDVDTFVIRLFGSSDLPLEAVVLAVINANDLALSQKLIQSLVYAGMLSASSAAALGAAMVKPAPTIITWGKSIVETATGVDDYIVNLDET